MKVGDRPIEGLCMWSLFNLPQHKGWQLYFMRDDETIACMIARYIFVRIFTLVDLIGDVSALLVIFNKGVISSQPISPLMEIIFQ